MNPDNPPETCEYIHFAELADTEGRLILLPVATLDQLKAKGLTSITLTIAFDSSKAPEGWLTVTEAARQHLEDLDGMTLNCAKGKISRVCNANQITCEGKGPIRRIEPNSLAAWRLRQRQKNLGRLSGNPRQGPLQRTRPAGGGG